MSFRGHRIKGTGDRSKATLLNGSFEWLLPMTAPDDRASVRVGPNGRILALSVAWFSEGVRLRVEARRAARCVECGRALPNHRTPYCSRRCQWQFHGHFFWDSARSYVMLRDRYTCRLCGTRRRARDLDVDHIVEIARGGAALEYSNLQTVCRPCHRRKTRAFMTAPRHPPEPKPADPGYLPDGGYAPSE
ncbi:MAG: HNH endonuclease [Thermoplasmata archaeon]